MIVVGLIAIVGGLGLYFGFDNFRGYSFHSNRDLLVSALQHARSRAVSNICYGSCSDGKSHGVYIEDDQYIIFQGSSYDDRDQEYDAIIETNPGTTHQGMNEVVFAQLKGDADPGEIELENDYNERMSTITINSEGQIIWTN